VYVAELDADVDDVVAVHYLHGLNLLDYVVLDPAPVEDVGKQRLSMLNAMDIEVREHLESKNTNVFCGGQLTEIARCIRAGGTIDNLVLQGGFVGSNIVPQNKQLKKFKNKEAVRTFNFNCDVAATDYVLRTTEDQIGTICCIGKNVCHSDINSDKVLWRAKKYRDMFEKYNVREGKLQHDMLACHEGIALLGLGGEVGISTPFCSYLTVRPFNMGLNGNKTVWGSKKENERSQYRTIRSATMFESSKYQN
jgi:inosine-uridine nucleoside N-ribohydrolase